MAAESKLPRDYWEDDNQAFVHFGKRYVLAPNLRTICLGPVTETANEIEQAATNLPAASQNQRVKPSGMK